MNKRFTWNIVLILLLSGCACTKDMAAGGATYLALGADPVTAVADMVIEGLTCQR